jgi:hypothetical protein
LIAGISSTVATQVQALKQDTALREMAKNAGLPLATVATIIGLGLGLNWIGFSDLQEFILPALAGGLGVAGSSYLMNRASSKYGQYLGALGVGASTAAAAYTLLVMIDNVKLAMEV